MQGGTGIEAVLSPPSGKKTCKSSRIEHYHQIVIHKRHAYLSFLMSVMATESAPNALAAMRATRPAFAS